MKPALEAKLEKLKTTVKDGNAVKKGPGRPSNAAKALEEARKAGELLVVATLAQFNDAVAKAAEEMQSKPKKGNWTRNGGRVSDDMLTSNRRRPGVKSSRSDEAAGTKLKIAEHMKQLRAASASESEWKRTCCKVYSKNGRL